MAAGAGRSCGGFIAAIVVNDPQPEKRPCSFHRAPTGTAETTWTFQPLRVITYVMTASSIPAAGGGGYARYLESKTVAPERGDYYLTPDGEMTQAPGRWLADPETLARLGVRAGEPVEGADFIALMDGRHPGTGRWLRPEGAGGGRGGGIDVTFSAPKSVSTVWALRPTRLSPAGRDRRALHRPHRWLASQQRDGLRRGHARPDGVPVSGPGAMRVLGCFACSCLW